MRVSKSSDHWCAFGTISNFEKRNLRSGHLIRPGHVTFGVIGSSFFGNVSNCWLNSYGKFGGATRRRFFAIYEKPNGGGGEINPPPVRGLINVFLLKYVCFCLQWSRLFLAPFSHGVKLILGKQKKKKIPEQVSTHLSHLARLLKLFFLFPSLTYFLPLMPILKILGSPMCIVQDMRE